MRRAGTTIELSASDLSQFLGCRHRTALDLAVAHGQRQAPSWVDPLMVVLRERGLEHERGYADSLRAEGLGFVDLTDRETNDAVEPSLDAMRAGVDVILQPALRSGRWVGRPDLLRRVATNSGLGTWSYEVYDTKLARETRGGTVLQLALYTEMLRIAQGALPASFHVVTPDPDHAIQTFRVQDYDAYFRLVRDRLEASAQQEPDAIAAANYPEPVEHCDVCRWWSVCDKRRRADDHLSLVAGISRLQTRELEAAGVTTLAQLGGLPLPLPLTPRRGAIETYVRVREQARLQVEGRVRGAPTHELLLPIASDQGLARLPQPSPGDMFLDLEGDRFAADGPQEFLFGLVIVGGDGTTTSRAFWARTRAEERAAFEVVVELIVRGQAENPGMHVYHYAPYETTAFKRLMSRHATRETEIDRMLRAEVFVDLFAVVKRALRASVEGYSIKDLEPLYGFTRTVALADARTNLRVVERALALGGAAAIPDDVRAAVEGYNRDDCVSALELRDWLEKLRADLEASGTEVPRPEHKDGAPSERLSERTLRTQALAATLIAGIPTDPVAQDGEQRARMLLANLLEWHRREDKAAAWDFYRLCELSEDDLLDEKAAIAGLRLAERRGGAVDRYAYPPQDVDVRKRDKLRLQDESSFGSVDAIDRAARTIDVKKPAAKSSVHPSAIFVHAFFSTQVLADALFRIGEDVAEHGASAGTEHRAARDLLLGRPPRLRSGKLEPAPGEDAVDFAVRIAGELDQTVLAIQGPPGAGKTFTGSRMICELVRRGARIGVTAVSHKVVRNLLDAVTNAADELGAPVPCLHKVGDDYESAPGSRIAETDDNADALAQLASRRAAVVGGTAWLWARPDAHEVLDVLFVDEAGQMSLAMVLAASQAAKSVVLLGDPRQLEQPRKGSHPPGADRSALEHLLGEHDTIPPERGIFLPVTWRLAPAICAFTSEVFYEGRLNSLAGLERQVLVGAGPLDGAGLFVARVGHEGNQSSSREEVEAVARIVARLLDTGVRWIDLDGVERPLAPSDVLIVAPYNAHVGLLSDRLGARGVRIGTVDKFQGQEAPVVIYSMATSTPEDAPRGMEFLYSQNRLNVATSRARCACILVASPRLFEPECKSPRQMQLANAICRYVELARAVDWEAC